ncbi:MAG: transcriptional repressor LexA, partial [Chthoniobacteraceae bacterium]
VRPNMNLTVRQQQVLAFIASAQQQTGVTPSTREIQEHFGFASQTAAVNHLRALERKGVLQRHAGKARAMALVSTLNRDPIIDIPIYGSIAAGLGELTEESREGTLSMDIRSAGLRSAAGVFALKVRGDSMIGAQISDGDLVVLEQRGPKNDDIVAALIDGETTLKRFILNRGRAFLKAENPGYPDMIPVTELVIQGVMVALVRKVENRN